MLLLSSHRRIDGSCRAVVQTTRIILRVSYNSSALAAVVQNQRLSMNNGNASIDRQKAETDIAAMLRWKITARNADNISSLL